VTAAGVTVAVAVVAAVAVTVVVSGQLCRQWQWLGGGRGEYGRGSRSSGMRVH
jgi:hypothetical protein